ncbi:bacillithiol biosynthesis protein BshC [Planococcus koreensis]|uniref:bacillithiol biosynthesis protein BshC n=1 Tax=Planococcus koreensis TaxID=112331 RepID=UPI00240D7D00|nr:bacillithiol biosynthesis BshC [Planococcus koreensis]
MNIEELYIEPASKLMNDYINGEPAIGQFFSYKPDTAQFKERYQKLKEHPVDRHQLTGILRNYMSPNGLSENAEKNLAAFEAGAPS